MKVKKIANFDMVYFVQHVKIHFNYVLKDVNRIIKNIVHAVPFYEWYMQRGEL